MASNGQKRPKQPITAKNGKRFTNWNQILCNQFRSKSGWKIAKSDKMAWKGLKFSKMNKNTLKLACTISTKIANVFVFSKKVV